MTFTKSLIELLSHPGLSKWNPRLARFLLQLYTPRSVFWNAGLIGLLGMLINQLVLHFFVNFIPLWLANFCAILLAWGWNYHNMLGKLAKYWWIIMVTCLDCLQCYQPTKVCNKLNKSVADNSIHPWECNHFKVKNKWKIRKFVGNVGMNIKYLLSLVEKGDLDILGNIIKGE